MPLLRLPLLVKILLVVGTLYAAAVIYPQPAFAHHVRYGSVDVWSDEPIPAGITAVLDDAHRRLRRSPWYDEQDSMRLFICNAPWRLWFFGQRFSTTMGGGTSFLTRHIFLHAADIEANALRMPPGRSLYDAEGRTLSYFIAHEGTHALTARVQSILSGYRLPAWLREGYADYVAKGPDFDLATQRDLYRVGALERPPRDYKRYQLEVDFMLHEAGRSLDQLFAAPPTEAEVRRLLDAHLATQP